MTINSLKAPMSPASRMPVQACALPEGSRILASTPGADFADCYRFADASPQASALQTYLALVARTPGWMNALMALRNQAVRLVGLKHLGSLNGTTATRPAASYQVGDRVGIFSLLHAQADEVVLGDNDKHLRVELSLVKHQVQGQAMVSISTVVHIHNRLGKVYMSVVGPVHQRIVPWMLAQAASAQP